jgi:outer membrane protein assembly factor BamB
MIVASETRSDGPWTAGFGIYGIDARTGKLLWTNHGRGLWGRLLRCFDCVPGYTNEFRDVPKCVVGQYVVTAAGRILDIRTGRQCPSATVTTQNDNGRSAPDQRLYDNKSLRMDGDTIRVQGSRDDFVILRRDNDGREIWRFAARDRALHVDGNYYSYRFHDGHIFIVLGDAPNYVPIKETEPLYVKPNPANYQLGILDVSSGECGLFPLVDAKQRNECRIEAIRDNRVLISCDGTQLVEYNIAR